MLLKLEQLKQSPSKTVSASSLEVSYAEERAKIAQAKLEVEPAKIAIAHFKADWEQQSLEITLRKGFGFPKSSAVRAPPARYQQPHTEESALLPI